MKKSLLISILITLFLAASSVSAYARPWNCVRCCLCDHQDCMHPAIPGMFLERGTIIAGGTIFADIITWGKETGLIPREDIAALNKIADNYQAYAAKQHKKMAKLEILLHMLPLNKQEITDIHNKVRKIADNLDARWINDLFLASDIFKRNKMALKKYGKWFRSRKHPENLWQSFVRLYTPEEWERLKEKYGSVRLEESFKNEFFVDKVLTKKREKIGANGAVLITDGGVHVVIFDTPYGRLYVNLPDDMAMGDIISGQLTLQPTGQEEKQRDKNLKKLAQHYLELGKQRISAGADWGKWTIPEVDKLSVTLMDPKGKTVASTEVPVQPQPAPFHQDFSCQSAGVAGGMFQYFGEFDGDFSDTDGHIGDRELTKWAESPRKVILESPKDIIGLCTVTLTEGDYRGECSYRGLSIQAAAGKDTLLKGESTTLTVTVRGLEGLAEEIPLGLENKTADIVRMDREGVFSITPDDVQLDGTYTTSRRITGIMPGRFHISAAVPIGCKHCTKREIFRIISDDCTKVKAGYDLEHCKWGVWHKTGFRGGYTFPKVSSYPENPKKCTKVVVYHQYDTYAQYLLYHYNGRKGKDGNPIWDFDDWTQVKKVTELPAAGEDCQSVIVKEGEKHTFYHHENGRWGKKGEWQEKEKKKK